MAREEYIRIYRSDDAGATPSLTSGEIAANLVDGKLFIGGTNGSLIQFTTDSYSVTGVNGLTGNVSITGDGGAVYGVSNNIIAARVAGYSATGFAAFNSTFFDVGSTGLVSLTGVYVDANGVSGSLQSLSYHEGTTSSISLSIPVRTNLIKHTQDYVTLDFELWNAYGGSPTITNLGNVATNGWPNGSTGGIQLAFAANSNNGIYQKWPTGTLQTNTIYTLSCWARSSSGTEKARFSYFDAETNLSYFSEDFTLTTVPQRVSYTFRTRSTNSSSNIAFGNGSGSATGTVLTWGFQLEEGSVPTSLIPNSTGEAKQGNAQVVSIDLTNRIASASITGVASFDPLHFNIGSTGHVRSKGVITINSLAPDENGNFAVAAATVVTGDGGAIQGKGNAFITTRLGSYTLTGVASFDPRFFGIGTSGHLVLTGSYQVTGDTIQAGSAINIGTGKVINNIGVTAFNGLTGNVSLTGDGGAVQGKLNNAITTRLTTAAGATGLASFRDTHFLVDATGHVQLAAAYQVTGQTVVAGYGIDLVASGNTRTINNRGVTSFNGLTGNVSLTGDGGAVQGKLNNTITTRIATDAVTGVASFDPLHFNIGSSGHVRSKGVITINSLAPDENGNFAVAAATVVTGDGGAIQGKGNAFITARFAGYSATGVASFNGNDFVLGETGSVSLTGTVARTNISNSWGANQDFGIYFISASSVQTPNIYTTFGDGAVAPGVITVADIANRYPYASGIRLAVTPADENYLYLTIKGSTTMTEDRVIESPNDSGVIALTKTTVSSFNGLTGNVSLTGDGGAVQGKLNNTITTRLTTAAGATGLASFRDTHFLVDATGHVQLAAAYQATGDTVITVAGSGIGIVTSGKTDTLYNIGVTSFNGLTGNVSLTGDGGAVQGKLNNSITVRVIADNAMTGVASFRNTHFLVDATGHVQLATAYQATGQTVVAGYGIDLVASGNTRTINNRGVTSFNGLTGNVSLTGDGGAVQGRGNTFITTRLTTAAGATGLASFRDTHFLVDATGHVQLAAAYQATGDTVITVVGSGIGIVTSGKTDTLYNIGVTGIGFGNDVGLTGKINLTAGSNITMTQSGNTVTISGVAQQITAVTGDGAAIIGKDNAFITARIATDSVTGVASFSNTYFSVAGNGAVSLATAYQVTGDTVQAGSGISIGSGKVITNIGVTGVTTGTLSYGNTGFNGLRISSLTGNIVIENTGVRALTVQGYTTTTSPLWYQKGPQIRASSGISVNAGWDDEITLLNPYISVLNTGVLSINGVGGILLITGDGGAVYGVGNETIAARVATDSLTGVASFSNTYFSVSNGAVSLATAYQVTGDTIITVAGSGIGIATSGKTDTLYNIGVTSFNGVTGNVSLTGDGQAIQGKGNNTITARVATDSLTGVASFSNTYFSVSNGGAVSLATAYQVTGDTVLVGGGLNMSTSGRTKTINNIGVTGIGFGNDVGLTGKINLTAGSNITITRSGNTITVAGSAGGDTISDDAGAIDVITTSGTNKKVTVRPASYSLTGVAYFSSTNFIVGLDGYVTLNGGGPGPMFNELDSGMGASANADGSLAYLYFDAGNLTFNSATTLDPANDFVLFYDASQTGLLKTKRIKAERILLDNDSVFNSKSTQFVKSKSSSNIEFEILTAPVTQGETKLLESGDAFTYIAQNTVRTLNGATGNVAVVGNINGCTGAIVITGTTNEVVVTNSCPNITIGLPDNVSIPYLSGTGATFTQTVTATRFIGIVSGGDF